VQGLPEGERLPHLAILRPQAVVRPASVGGLSQQQPSTIELHVHRVALTRHPASLRPHGTGRGDRLSPEHSATDFQAC